MVQKIEQKIVGYQVKTDSVPDAMTIKVQEEMHEDIKRDDDVSGKTYKVKVPTSEHALYVTVNHMNVGGKYYPIECFINCKEVSHQQWITALTRLISSVFRKGGKVRFIADELMQVTDPAGGHWTKKGANGEKPKFMPSLTAEIGYCLSKHFDYIDTLNNREKQPVLNETVEAIQIDQEEVEYPKNAEICPSCKQKSALRLDGCLACVNSECNFSKCG